MINRHPFSRIPVSFLFWALLFPDFAISFSNYRPYDSPGGGLKKAGIHQLLYRLHSKYPKLSQIKVIGRTHQGREILAIQISERPQSPQPKPAVLFIGGQHGREWVSVDLCVRLIQYLLSGYARYESVQKALKQVSVWVIPVANPDGYQLSFSARYRDWRKNLRDNNQNRLIDPGDGVDINRNYPFHFAVSQAYLASIPYDGDYGGKYPFSEPETQAIQKFLQTHPFRFLVSYHTFGNYIVYPARKNSWLGEDCLDYPIFRAIAGDDQRPAIRNSLRRDSTGVKEPYRVRVEFPGINGRLESWAYHEKKILSFYVELTDAYGFRFPDNPRLLKTLFNDNLPFIKSIIGSALNPLLPATLLNNRPAPIYHQPLRFSYGQEQMIEALVSTAIDKVVLKYRHGYQGNFQRVVMQATSAGVFYRLFRAKIPCAGFMTYYFTLEQSAQKIRFPADRDLGFHARKLEPGELLFIGSPESRALKSLLDKKSRQKIAYWNLKTQGVPGHFEVLSHYLRGIIVDGQAMNPSLQKEVVTYLQNGGRLLFLTRKVPETISGKEPFSPSPYLTYTPFTKPVKEIRSEHYQIYGGTDHPQSIDRFYYFYLGLDVRKGIRFNAGEVLEIGSRYDQKLPAEIILEQPRTFLPNRSGKSIVWLWGGGERHPRPMEPLYQARIRGQDLIQLEARVDLSKTVSPQLRFDVLYQLDPRKDLFWVEITDLVSNRCSTAFFKNNPDRVSLSRSNLRRNPHRLDPFAARYFRDFVARGGGKFQALTGVSYGFRQETIDLSRFKDKTVRIGFFVLKGSNKKDFQVLLTQMTVGRFPLHLKNITQYARFSGNRWRPLEADLFRFNLLHQHQNTISLQQVELLSQAGILAEMIERALKLLEGRF